jgi:hydroxymethylglutaryl-CoA synthase
MTESKSAFTAKTKPSLLIATNVGNMYTPSLYGGLVSYLCEEPEPANKRIALFSYGSGLASSLFSIRINEGPALVRLLNGLSDVKPRLESRRKVCPSDFSATMKLREETHHCAPYHPVADLETLYPETWYLESVDELHRRAYKKTSGHVAAQNGHHV